MTTQQIIWGQINPSPSGGGGGGTPTGRLTLTSGVPVTTSDVTGATNVYYTPYVGNTIQLWDGANWTSYAYSELTLALGTLTAFTPYDVFIYNNSGSPALEMLAWLNATVTISIANPAVITWTSHGITTEVPVVFTTSGALPTGMSPNVTYYALPASANTFNLSTTPGNLTIVVTSGSQSGTQTGWQSNQRGTPITLQDGRYCKSGDKTRLYLGTFYTTSTTTTEDSGGGVTTQVGGKRFLWNMYNRVLRNIDVIDTTNNWSYQTDAIRQANGTRGNQVEFVVGLSDDAVAAQVMATVFLVLNTSVAAKIGIGLDTTTSFSGLAQSAYNTNNSVQTPMNGAFDGEVAVGYHFLSWNESGADGTTCAFLGLAATAQSGMFGRVRA